GFARAIAEKKLPRPAASGGGGDEEPPEAAKPNRWFYIRQYHDTKATEVFGPGQGRRVENRTYDKDVMGRDVEFKSDNFAKRARGEEELARMDRQIQTDAALRASGRANPH